MPIKNPQKKAKLMKKARQTKWAPVWAVLKKYGPGKRVHPSSEVIVVTGFGSDETVLSSLNYGAMSYIQKPISFSEIKVQTELAFSKQTFNIMTNKIKNLLTEQDSSLVSHFQNIINLDMFSVFLNMSIDIDSLADLILYGINEILSCKYCSFFFIDDINREIVISSAKPIHRSVVSAIEKELVETFETLANKKLEKTYVIRPSSPASFVENSDINKPALTSIIVPIFIENSIQGLLSISNEGEPFPQDAKNILHLLTFRASRALTNATLHRDTKLLALTDGLTGLLNHRAFRDRLVGEFERQRRYGSFLSIIIADFDNLKSINDTYGHPAGDKILRIVGDILRETTRDSDVLARYGGDEFVILLPQTNMQNAYNMAERIRKRVKEYVFELQGKKINNSITIGIACVPHVDINSPDDLFNSADSALYKAKRDGKNRVYVSGMDM